jgi:hypothetical protein
MSKYTILISAIFLAGCQTETANTNYVSTAQYEGYNCKQIAREMQRVSKKIDANSVTTEQDTTNAVLGSAVMIYGMSQGYGFYNDNGGNNSENARLVATYDALEQLSIQKDCKE